MAFGGYTGHVTTEGNSLKEYRKIEPKSEESWLSYTVAT
jgi:hypothetical protein